MTVLKQDLPTIPKHYVNITTNEHIQWLHDDLRAETTRYVAFDTETTGLGRGDVIFGFSVAVSHPDDLTKPERCYWCNLGHIDDPVMEELILDELKYIFGCTNEKPVFGVIMHNSIFDIRQVRQTYPDIIFNGKLNDTYLMAQVMKFKHQFAGLKELGHRLLSFQDHWEVYIKQWFSENGYKSGDLRYDDVPDLLMFPYACADVELTYKLFFVLREDFKILPESLEQIYLLERQVAPVTSSMEYYGMPIDEDYLVDLKNKLESTLGAWEKEFQDLWGLNFNPNSGPQKVKILYGKNYQAGEIGLPILAKTPSGAGKTDAETLEALEEWCKKENEGDDSTELLWKQSLLSKLANFGRLEHLLNNFVEGILSRLIRYGGELAAHETNPTIHTSYRQIIATGRFSSKDINLQNIPNDAFSRTKGLLEDDKIISIRRAFCCPKDYAYLKFDYAAFELRILGNAANDPRFIAMILEGVDMHSWLAMKLYNYDMGKDKLDGKFSDEQLQQWEQKATSEFSKKWQLTWEYWAIKSKSNQELLYRRNMVKICSFEIYYGAGAAKIAATHHITLDEANGLKRICKDTFPTVFDWRDQVHAYAERTSKVTTLFGRIIEIEKNRLYTQAVNAIIQGTAADLLKFAMVGIYNVIKNEAKHPGSRMIATIHDEIQILLHRDDWGIINSIVEAMEMRRLPEKFPLEMLCEPGVTFTNWAEMKDLHKGETGYTI